MTPHFAIVVEGVDEDAGTSWTYTAATAYTLAWADRIAEGLYPSYDGVGIRPLTLRGAEILAAERPRPDPLDLCDVIPF